MPERLRMEVGDDFADGLDCAICTAPALRVNHLSKFADYISCDECGSSFVVEADGDRVLYGKIAEEYTDTEKVVLKNWMSLTVVARLAGSERLRKELGELEIPRERRPEEIESELDDTPLQSWEAPEEGSPEEPDEIELPESPEDMTPEEPDEIELPESPEDMTPEEPDEIELPESLEDMTPEDVEFPLRDRLKAVADTSLDKSQMEVDVIDALDVPDAMALGNLEEELDDSDESGVIVPVILPVREESAIESAAEARVEPSILDGTDAEESLEPVEEVPVAALPERYYRVCIEGEGVYFPMKACVHCMQVPASRKISLVGSLPAGESIDRRRRAVFSLPLCMECHQKHSDRSEAQKNAQLQAHLTAVVVGLALVVAALGLGVVDIGSNAPLGLSLLGIIAGVGYLLPAWLLLARTQRIPPPPETHRVRTTLIVRGPDEPAADTNFNFRNMEYAQLFRESNPTAARGEVEEIMIAPDLAPE